MSAPAIARLRARWQGRAASRTPAVSTRRRLGVGPGLGLGVATLWLSLIVLLPLAVLVVTSAEQGWHGLATAVTDPAVAAALRLTVGVAALVTVVNALMGTLAAWVLVRDRFPGRRLLELVIDVPFALPTIVAGLVLLSLYGPTSPVGVEIAQTRKAILVAVLFVTLPFVVRAVQPVLLELDQTVEEAAACLGARRLTIVRRLVLPELAPAIASGAALTFARALGEYGAVVLIAGNMPFRTEIASVRILTQIENDQTARAAATATVLLLASVLVIAGLDLVQHRAARHG